MSSDHHLLCTIRQSPDRSKYDFLVRDLRLGSFSFAVERPVLASDRNHIEQRLKAFRESVHPGPGGGYDAAESLELLRHLGDEITSHLLPQGIQKLLLDREMAGAVVVLETNELSLPWELARLEGQWLWERFVVARREIRPSFSSVNFAPELELKSGQLQRMLVVADPEGSLPSARDEARALVETFSASPHWEVHLLEGPQATTENLIEHLQAEPYSILHFAAMADFNVANPLYSRLYLADEPLPAGRLREVRFKARPRVVVLNACQSGREAADTPLMSRSSGWARLFLDMGAGLVLGPLWDTSDEVSASLVTGMYRRLLGGASFGQALQAVRKELLKTANDDPFATVHAYVAYGDPLLCLEAWPGIPSPTPASEPDTAVEEERTAEWRVDAAYHLAVVAGHEVGRRVPLTPQTMVEERHITIGSPGARINEVEFDDPHMANEEAFLHFHDGHFYLVNQSRSPHLHVNGTPMGSRILLKGGERIELGRTTLVFVAGENRTADRYGLEVLRGVDEDVGRTYLMASPVTRVGRLPDCSVRLQDPAVSRHHLSIIVKDGTVTLTHEGSTTTLVNGMAVHHERRLQHGDEIQLSPRTVLRFTDRSMEVF